MTCKPQRPVSPTLPADPCARLQLVEEALFALASGQKRVEVRHGEQWVKFSDGNVQFLERERARLLALCGNNRGAITIERTPSGYPPGPGRYNRYTQGGF